MSNRTCVRCVSVQARLCICRLKDVVCLSVDLVNSTVRLDLLVPHTRTRGVHPPKPLMHIPYPPYFSKIYKSLVFDLFLFCFLLLWPLRIYSSCFARRPTGHRCRLWGDSSGAHRQYLREKNHAFICIYYFSPPQIWLALQCLFQVYASRLVGLLDASDQNSYIWLSPGLLSQS